MRAAVWSELASSSAIDTYRRNLQRGYLERMAYLMDEEVEVPDFAFLWRTPVDVSQSDIRPFVRGELKALRADVERSLRRVSDRATRYHLDDVLVRIEAILDPD